MKKKKKKKHKRRSSPAAASSAIEVAITDQSGKEQLLRDKQDRMPLPPQRPQSRLGPGSGAHSLKWWVSGWRLLVELITVVGLPLTVYALRPVLSVTSLAPSDIHNNNGSKASITVTGTGIKDVRVRCVTNKVVFQDRDTLALARFTVIDEYSVKDVAVGESFTADCNFVWSLWRRPTDGLFLMGGGSAGKP